MSSKKSKRSEAMRRVALRRWADPDERRAWKRAMKEGWREKGGHSDETKEKIRVARAKQVFTDETREKLSRAQKKRWVAARNGRVDPPSVLEKRYGITAEEFKKMARDGCMICGSKLFLNVDHDHETGKLRGVLCWKCNVGLGHLGDDVGGVRRALRYLKRAKGA